MMKINKYTFTGLFLLLIISCNTNRPSKPDVIISTGSMVDILTDLYLTDGLINIPDIRSKFDHKDSVEIYMEVIENYGFSKEVFDKNLEYYFLSKPRKFETIYDGNLRIRFWKLSRHCY